MSTKPLISIVSPSYNQAEFLERTLKSVLDQGYDNLEYMVFDGGSDDGSVDIIKKYEDRLAYWVSEKDNGQSHALNKGFKRVTGDIIGWLNSDDTLLPGCLDTVVKAFEENPEAGAIYGDFLYIDEQDRPVRHRKLFKNFRYETLLFHDYLGQPAVFYRKEALDATGLIDEDLHYGMDWDFFLRMKRATKMVYVPKTLATFRLQPASKSSGEGNERMRREWLKIFSRNKIRKFKNDRLDDLYFRMYRIYSLFLRVYVLVRDNPIDYIKMYRYLSKDRYVKGILWRIKHF